MNLNFDLWPNHSNIKKIESIGGFSDEYLEFAVKKEFDSFQIRKCFFVPWLYWTVELYSFGKCYRKWLNIPKWFPLPFYGDHGVDYTGSFFSHEILSYPKVHLTFSGGRYNNLLKNNRKKKIIRIPHPWITYRRSLTINEKTKRGTLIFYSHSVIGIELQNYNWNKYFDELKKLPNEFYPLSICMHMHDINKGYHKVLRKHEIPIVSAGETSSSFFVDRFYDIVSNFEYATSNTGGSELFYCEEFGIRYFLFGDKPTYFNFSHDQLPIGEIEYKDKTFVETDKKKELLFSQFPPVASDQKRSFVEHNLGLDLCENKAKSTLRKMYWLEIIRHLHLLPKFIMKVFYFELKKMITNDRRY